MAVEHIALAMPKRVGERVGNILLADRHGLEVCAGKLGCLLGEEGLVIDGVIECDGKGAERAAGVLLGET